MTDGWEVGGEVVILGWIGRAERIDTIERLTSTQGVLARGGRFSRRSGVAVGGGHWSVRVPTDSDRERVERLTLGRALTAAAKTVMDWPVEKVRRVAAAMEDKE